MSKLKGVCIGAGYFSKFQYEAWNRIPEVTIAAMCNRNAERAQAIRSEYGVPRHYIDYREMLEKETGLDGVIVASPDFMHAEHSIACLNAGLHVYCEKEMSDSIESAAGMVTAAQSSGKLCQIGHQRRSNPVYQNALEMIQKDKICGQLTNCYGQWNRSVQPKLTWPARYVLPDETLKKYGYDSMVEFYNWRWFRKYSSGPIADLGSHQIDIYSWFLGTNPDALVAMGGGDFYPDRQWYEDVMVTYDYPTAAGSVRAFYQVLNTNGFGSYFERFYGAAGTLNISESLKQCWYVPEGGHEAPAWMSDVTPIEMNGQSAIPLKDAISAKSPAGAEDMAMFEAKSIHQLHLENFFDAVRSGDKTRLNCSVEIGYETAVAVLSVIPAIENGGPTRLPASAYQV